ncbi:MAG: hypothetical protein K2X38_02630 [Gemmataceae bacterium]|nr:hypothetical protein [Gemmataceae bacterium]
MTYYQLAMAALSFLAWSAAIASAQPAAGKALAEPPKGFDVVREGSARGKMETVEYDSKTVEMRRKAKVYTPPGYDKNAKYPVLYLLHGTASAATTTNGLAAGRRTSSSTISTPTRRRRR